MADDSQDESSKTEDPTQRRLDDAAKKGQVPNSREVNNFLMLCTFALVLFWLAPIAMGKIFDAFGKFIHSPHDMEVSEDNASNLMSFILGGYGGAMMPIVVAAIAAALLSGLAQNPLNLSFDSITPKLEKISVIKGIKRMFSLRTVSEFVKGILKIIMVGAIVYVVLMPLKDQLDSIIYYDLMDILQLLKTTAGKIMIGVLSFMMFVAIADFIYQKFEHKKGLMMSRHDIKEEMRQSDGDPQVKAKLRQIRMERARKRMMAAVPEANVVITNPTHFSIALKYDQDTMAAPMVVAKGLDNIAFKIREIAEEHDIPLVENPPLARALYDAVEVDEEITLEFYQTVAEIISYVYKLKQNKAA